MKAGIHPIYNETTITCACGSSIESRNTREKVSVEICSSCHPFYTGTHKLVDAEGRVQRFMKKYEKNKKQAS